MPAITADTLALQRLMAAMKARATRWSVHLPGSAAPRWIRSSTTARRSRCWLTGGSPDSAVKSASCGTIHSVVQPASRGPGRPPAAKAAETRKRILRAAREVFSERGYDAATFQAIAIRADLTRPAINHYFANKRVLYWQVLDETNNAVVAASAQRARSETTLTGRVAAFIEGSIEAEIENRTAAAFLITATLESQRHPELSRPGTDSVSTTRAFLSWAINDGIQRGELNADTDAAALTEMLLAVLLGVGFYAGFIGSRHELDPVTDQLKTMLARSLARRRGQPQ